MKYEGKKKNQTTLQKQHIRLIEWTKGKAEYEGVFFFFENSDQKIFQVFIAKKIAN